MAPLRSSLAGSLIAAAAAGLTAWGVCHLWTTRLGHASLSLRLGEVFVPMILATAVYFGASALAGVPAARELAGVVWKRIRPAARPA
jgi:peptidoglycan biosynthesis protein MviN/MurJ (putative lipid II flippase)